VAKAPEAADGRDSVIASSAIKHTSCFGAQRIACPSPSGAARHLRAGPVQEARDAPIDCPINGEDT